MDIPKANGIAPLYHYQRNASHPRTGGLNAGLYIDKEGYLASPFFDHTNTITFVAKDERKV